VVFLSQEIAVAASALKVKALVLRLANQNPARPDMAVTGVWRISTQRMIATPLFQWFTCRAGMLGSAMRRAG
jgi:hypothetical protein